MRAQLIYQNVHPTISVDLNLDFMPVKGMGIDLEEFIDMSHKDYDEIYNSFVEIDFITIGKDKEGVFLRVYIKDQE